MHFALFDVVELTEDLPDENLHVGMKGAVVDLYTTPCEAYEVEFCDDNGKTISMLALLPNQIKLTLNYQ
jgi:hypothetical protein